MTEPTKRIPSLVALGGGHGLSATLRAGRLVADHVTAVVTVADGGVVRLHGEYTYPLEAGMTDRQLEDFVFGGCRLIVALMHEAEEQFPDELRGSLEP